MASENPCEICNGKPPSRTDKSLQRFSWLHSAVFKVPYPRNPFFVFLGFGHDNPGSKWADSRATATATRIVTAQANTTSPEFQKTTLNPNKLTVSTTKQQLTLSRIRSLSCCDRVSRESINKQPITTHLSVSKSQSEHAKFFQSGGRVRF